MLEDIRVDAEGVPLDFVGAVAFVPGVQVALKAAPPAWSDWLLVLPLSLVGTFWLEARKWVSLSRRA